MPTYEFECSSSYIGPRFEYYSIVAKKSRHGLSAFKDDKIIEYAQKNEERIPDNKLGILNYFGREGWEYISENEKPNDVIQIYFKRQK